MKHKAIFIIIAIAIFCIFLAVKHRTAERIEKSPSIILISLDTLRADHLSLYGYERKTSPFLDSLGERYTYFTKAYSQATWTLPSHYSMMTGLLPSQHGIWNDRNFSWDQTDSVDNSHLLALAKMLGDAYDTMASVNGGFMRPAFGLDKGFREYVSVPRQSLRKRSPEIWQSINKSQKPFFLFLHTYEIHSWSFDPLQYSAIFRDENSPIKESNPDKVKWDCSEDEKQFLIDTYDEAILRADHNLERLLEPFMDKIDRGEIVVIITSDHGQSFWDDRDRKLTRPCYHGGLPYKEQCHVPLIITVPGGKRDYRVSAGIDLVPTILSLAGKPIPKNLLGGNLLDDNTGRIVITEALDRHSSIGIRAGLTYVTINAEIFDELGNLSDAPAPFDGQHIPDELKKELQALGYL